MNLVAGVGANTPASEAGNVRGKAALSKALGVHGESKLRETMMENPIDAQSL